MIDFWTYLMIAPVVTGVVVGAFGLIYSRFI